MNLKMKNLKKMNILLSMILVLSLLLGLPVHTDAEEGSSVLRIGWTTEPSTLSPIGAWSISATEFFQLVYDPLVGADNNTKPVGILAESWDISKDNLEWTFKLRDGVKWHDGTDFTSDDVKFTYELLKSSYLYAGLMEGMESIKTPDPHTVVIKTNQPKANMLQITAPILPKHIWENVTAEELDAWPNEHPIGTGPFKFEEFKKGEYLKISANEDYYLVSPKVDEIVFVLYANNDTMAQSLKIGELDAAINFNATQASLLKNEPNLNVTSSVSTGFTDIGINVWEDPKSKGNPLLLDKKIRHAMEYAIDKQKIIDIAYAGQGEPATTLVPPRYSFWHYEPSEAELRNYNPEKANQLLDDAGYEDRDGDGIREDSNGNKLEFRFALLSKNSEEVRAGQMIAKYLEEVGIGTIIETIDSGLLSEKIAGADFDLFIWGWGAALDPSVILGILNSNQIGASNEPYYSNQAYDQLLKEQATFVDDKERQEAVYHLQEIAYDDAPYILLTYDYALQAVNTEKWTGWKPIDGSYFFTFNTYNYLNVEPKKSEEIVVTTDNNNTDSKVSTDGNSTETKSSGLSSTLLILLIVVAVAGVTILLRNKNKKSMNFHDDV